jgi:hypothetical protein
MNAAFRALADSSRRLSLDSLQTTPERLWHALSDPAFTQRCAPHPELQQHTPARLGLTR